MVQLLAWQREQKSEKALRDPKLRQGYVWKTQILLTTSTNLTTMEEWQEYCHGLERKVCLIGSKHNLLACTHKAIGVIIFFFFPVSLYDHP